MDKMIFLGECKIAEDNTTYIENNVSIKKEHIESISSCAVLTKNRYYRILDENILKRISKEMRGE